MVNVVYIFGLGHSGSTLLDLMLSGHDQICGLGEVRMMTDPDRRGSRFERSTQSACGCGKTVAECPLWGPYITSIRANSEIGSNASFQELAHLFNEKLGPDVWLSDSSKSVEGLVDTRKLVGTVVSQLKVIHLIRDARSFAASQLAREKRRGIWAASRALSFWKKMCEYNLKELHSTELEYINVGYEELCLYPEFTTNRIANFLDLPFSSCMLNPSPSTSHVATGNPMRIDKEKSSRTLYDHRWFFRSDVNIAFQLVPGVAKLNDQLVYSATKPTMSTSFRPPTTDELVVVTTSASK